MIGPAPLDRAEHERRDRWRPETDRPWKRILWTVLDEAGVHGRGGLVVVPYRLADGQLHRERLFAPDGRTWWGPGEGLIPYGLDRLPPPAEARHRALLVAEGESDALALREAYAGVTAACPYRGYDVLSVPGATTWRAEWAGHLAPYAAVYVLGDGDEAGRRMNEAILRDHPPARLVRMPHGYDARAVLQRIGPRALDPLLDEADHEADLRAERRERQGRLYDALLGARTLGEWAALTGGEVLPHAA